MNSLTEAVTIIAYPGWAILAFLSCTVRLLVYWQINRTFKVISLAVTNLITFAAFSAMCAASHEIVFFGSLQPYVPWVWLVGLPFFAYSIWLEFKEVLLVLKFRNFWCRAKAAKGQINNIASLI